MRSGMAVSPKNPSWKVPMSNCDRKIATEEETNGTPTCHNNAHMDIECPELERCVGLHKPFIMCFVLWGLLVDRNPLFPHAVNLNWVDKLRDSYWGGKMPPLSGHCLAHFSGGPQTGPVFLNHEKDKLINHRGWDQKEGLPLPTATVLASNSLMVFS